MSALVRLRVVEFEALRMQVQERADLVKLAWRGPEESLAQAVASLG